MVSCDKGFVQIKGTRIELITDLACLMHSMVNDEVVDRDMLLELVDDACKSEEEIHEEAIKANKQLMNTMVQQIAELLSKGYDKDDILNIIKGVKEKK